MLRSRFDLAVRKLGFADSGMRYALDTTRFRPPAAAQMPLDFQGSPPG